MLAKMARSLYPYPSLDINKNPTAGFSNNNNNNNNNEEEEEN